MSYGKEDINMLAKNIMDIMQIKDAAMCYEKSFWERFLSLEFEKIGRTYVENIMRSQKNDDAIEKKND